MAEVAAVEPNGLTVASTFSGCGGSCLGFKLAGYRTVFASEFIPAAAASYRANYPDVPLDERDIRDLTGDDVRALSGLDEIDVLEGSPPCASFSAAGKGARHWGEVRPYSEGEQRTDDLFFEFARVLGELRPRAFVAENVPGLTRGVAKGYFKRVHAALADGGYRVEAKLLDAQWLGVAQARRRVIFIGTRDDLDLDPPFPSPLPYRYSIRDALPELDGRVFVGANGNFGGSRWHSIDEPSMTFGASPNTGNGRSPASALRTADGDRRLTIDELRRLCGFPADFALTGSYAQQWERLGRAVPPPMMKAVALKLAEALA